MGGGKQGEVNTPPKKLGYLHTYAYAFGLLSSADLSRQRAQSSLSASIKQQILRHKTHEFL